MTVIEALTSVWTEIMEWISTSITSLESLFYNAETGLTFVGVLTVAGVAIAVVLLLISMVKSLLRFN